MIFDIIVIGAGPGGSFFAENTANKLNVLLLDKETFPRDKLCAGWIPKKVLEILNITEQDYPHKIEILDNLDLWIKNKKYPVKHKTPHHFAIFRKEFDNYLLNRAIKSGAEFKQNVLVKDIEFHKEHVIIKTDKEDFKSKIVIGAGGTYCPLYKKFNKNLKENIVICLENEQKLEKNFFLEKGSILLEDDLQGYGWCYKKADHLNIGIGRINDSKINQSKNRFINTLKKFNLIPQNLDINFKGYIYRINDNPKRIISGNRFLLVGDSAGFASQFTGEGIGPALISAKIAANYALNQLKNNNTDLSGFSKIIRKKLKIKKKSKFPIFLNLLKISFIRNWVMKKV